MEKKISGRIIKSVGGKFTVDTDLGAVVCHARGVFKRDDTILVGDYVELTKDREWIITSVQPRRNSLIRPPVSNVDSLVIVLASEPAPDYYLLDKLLLICYNNDVEPIICINKCDLNSDVYDCVKKVYSDFVKIFVVSATEKIGLDDFVGSLSGTVCFCGQSAVGKTSLVNALFELEEETGGLSKIMRGRNTTRQVTIYKYNDNCSIIDTCGFSMLEAGLPDKNDVSKFYPDFCELDSCKYRSCLHVNEPDCQVKSAVKNKIIDKERYFRYLAIIGVLQKWKK